MGFCLVIEDLAAEGSANVFDSGVRGFDSESVILIGDLGEDEALMEVDSFV